MRKTLTDIMKAARENTRPIVHISGLAGQAPLVASTPCLGSLPTPLIDTTPDDYLSIMAEIRNALVVEHDETLGFLIFTGGARDPQAAHERAQLSPRMIAGSVTVAGAIMAVYYMLDSAGQETTIIYDGLRSFADIQDYWRRRGELVRAFTKVYAPIEEDLHALCYQFDRATKLSTFDLHAFARGRGLLPSLQHSAAS
jgi:hypothetical protein